MGRSHIKPSIQPDDFTCGPASLKNALKILGIRKTTEELIDLCKTTKNGTSTKHLIEAAVKLGLTVQVIEYATLRHVIAALRTPPNQPRASLVSYLYDLDEKGRPHPDSGHWAAVSSYQSDKGRIVLFDSSTGQKKSYQWTEFRKRWKDFDLKRKAVNEWGRQFKLIRKWQPQLLMILALKPEYLPKFSIPTQKTF